MNQTNPEVDKYLDKDDEWRQELEKIRSIVLGYPLTEELKWNKPCYTFQKSNLIGLSRLKEHCWIMFFKGVLLRDPAGILEKPGENSQSMRVIRFTSVGQIVELESKLKALIYAAIEAEKAGLQVDFKKSADLVFPEEFTNKLNESSELKTAFNKLTPGRQRGYNLYFSAAKQSRTRESRIEKCVQRILDGKGLNDR